MPSQHEFALLLRELGYGGVRLANRRISDPEVAKLVVELQEANVTPASVQILRKLLRRHRKNLAGLWCVPQNDDDTSTPLTPRPWAETVKM